MGFTLLRNLQLAIGKGEWVVRQEVRSLTSFIFLYKMFLNRENSSVNQSSINQTERLIAEALAPGQTIPFHKHHNAEEILLFEDPGARVIVGDKSGDANFNSIVFIPRNTWISATNTGKNSVHPPAIFSRHGFETCMRAISAKPDDPLKPLSQDELTRLRALGHATYRDTSKTPYPPGGGASLNRRGLAAQARVHFGTHYTKTVRPIVKD